MANMYIYNQVYPLRMEILLILSRKSYCFPLYNVAVPVDDSFAGYGLFPVIDDSIAKAWFHFHSPKSLFHCIDVCCSFEFESLSSFQLMKERIVKSISQTIRCEWKLGLNHVHFILGNIRRCFYHFMLSNSLSLFRCVFEDDSLS